MAESITISQLPPPFKSMQYDLLRAEGLKHIQDLSGNVWTDDNIHDPGITILEMLSYAITDLGYRTNYNIKDILTVDPNAPEDIKNFFAAKEIMPNYPVTFNDYRKLMIDVEIPSSDTPNCPFVGVQNAWIEKSVDNEIPFYVDRTNRTLSYTQPNASVARSQPKVLYDVLLEFSSCETLGDLNANTLDATLKLYLLQTVPPGVVQLAADMNGVSIKMEVQFPRWDTPGIDWSNVASIKSKMTGISIDFIGLPDTYSVDSYGLKPNGDFQISMTYNFIYPVDTSAIELEMNQFLYAGVDPLINLYQKKVLKINEILEAVHARLMANRNLGEDFFRYNAIKVDEILLCAEVDITNNAVVEEVQAEIYHRVERFLDPTVLFYSLTEMYAKGKTTDQIFDGPLLQHGFIDDEELVKAERRKTIHVSDLINIISDIPGVIAIKSIQIAGIPLDNDTNISVDTVKWCLDVPIEQNYVPRLSVERSKLLFFKDQLPYRANSVIAQELLDALEAADRPQKIENPDDDIHLEPGEYKDIQNYYSIQDEFPLVYGITSAGLPGDASIERKAQAKQLKGFLLFYDQLLAGYLSQLFHVKDLFSMNAAKGLDGNPIINKTYFSQSLVNVVPDALPLYNDPINDAAIVQAMTEDRATFLERRNRFLDHLMARFAESFNDYAMVVYDVDGPKAPDDLIQDKLEFLNNYPLISSARDTGFNYKDQCKIWSIDNISGLERRVSYLTGINKPNGDELAFTKKFDIKTGPTADEYYLEVNDGGFPTPTVTYVYSFNYATVGFPTLLDAKLGMEKLVTSGAQRDQYSIYDSLNTLIPDPSAPPLTVVPPFHFIIYCDGVPIGESPEPSTYMTLTGPGSITEAIDTVIVPTFQSEFYDNPESNRYNFECFMEKYVSYVPETPIFLPVVPPCPPEYIYHFILSDGDPDNPKTLLTGDLKGLIDESDPTPMLEQAVNNKENLTMDMLRFASDIKNYRYAFDPSNSNLEIFTVVNECGDVIAQSFEDDFNQHIQDILIAIKNQPPNDKFTVIDSTGNDGLYTASNIAQDGSNPQLLALTMVENIPSAIGDGFFSVEINFLKTPTLVPMVLDANTADNYFTVNKSLSRVLFPGDKVTVATGVDMGDYTVVKVVPSGILNSLVYVKETIPDTTPGSPYMNYTKLIPIVAVDNRQTSPGVFNTIFYLQPGANVVAAQELADWVLAKFFSHEGMHVLEHILMRPKYNMVGPPTPISAANGNQLQSIKQIGQATFAKQFALTGVDTINKKFTFSGNFAGDFIVPQPISIVGAPFNNGLYTAMNVVNNGPDTEITVLQTIPDGTIAGSVEYSKTYSIIDVVGPNLDQIKISDPFFVAPANNDLIISYSVNNEDSTREFKVTGVTGPVGTVYTLTLDSTVVQLGMATYLKQFALTGVNPGAKTFSFAGNFAGDVTALQSMRIIGSPLNDKTYTIRSASVASGTTTFVVYETIPDGAIAGNLQYSKTYRIQSVTGTNLDQISFTETTYYAPPANNDVMITGSFENVNNGKFHVSAVSGPVAGQYTFTFDTRVANIIDDFLPIEVHNPCLFCQFDDPYSFIISVILPAWQGRFFNQEFRRFLDRTLRLECPAHLVMNVCWVDCKQMGEVELKYKKWILENAKANPNKTAVSKALNELIEVLKQIRSVYPEGVLHDCNSDLPTDPTPENAVILNNTILGNL